MSRMNNQEGEIANQTGAKVVNREYDMAVFDRLPKEIRAWVRDLAYDRESWEVKLLYRRFIKTGVAGALVKLQADFLIYAQTQIVTTWGPEHPGVTAPAVKRGRGRPRKGS